ncbi:MAG: DUF975 family protein [Victivallaceae bacterium]|jgi:uncharacterized membrane protein
MNFRSETVNEKLMVQAFSVLRGNWVKAIAGLAIIMLLELAVSKNRASLGIVLQYIISGIISGPMALGTAIFALALSRRQNPQIWQILTGFKRFWTALCASVLMFIFILLWALLLIVPGIIAAIAYSMTYYILADNPDIGVPEAIRRSKAMMTGNKWKYFCFAMLANCLAVPVLVIPGYILAKVDMITAVRMPFYALSLLCDLLLTVYLAVCFAKFYDDLKPVSVAQPAAAEPAVPVAKVNTALLDALCTNQKN